MASIHHSSRPLVSLDQGSRLIHEPGVVVHDETQVSDPGPKSLAPLVHKTLPHSRAVDELTDFDPGRPVFCLRTVLLKATISSSLFPRTRKSRPTFLSCWCCTTCGPPPPSRATFHPGHLINARKQHGTMESAARLSRLSSLTSPFW
jgi:hypothetical protein